MEVRSLFLEIAAENDYLVHLSTVVSSGSSRDRPIRVKNHSAERISNGNLCVAPDTRTGGAAHHGPRTRSFTRLTFRAGTSLRYEVSTR